MDVKYKTPTNIRRKDLFKLKEACDRVKPDPLRISRKYRTGLRILYQSISGMPQIATITGPGWHKKRRIYFLDNREWVYEDQIEGAAK